MLDTVNYVRTLNDGIVYSIVIYVIIASQKTA